MAPSASGVTAHLAKLPATLWSPAPSVSTGRRLDAAASIRLPCGQNQLPPGAILLPSSVAAGRPCIRAALRRRAAPLLGPAFHVREDLR
jgi:hypothetical protein